MAQLLEKAAQAFINEVKNRHTIAFNRNEVQIVRRPKSNIFDCQAKKENGVEARGIVHFDNWSTLIDIEHFNDPRSIFIPYSEICEEEKI